MNKLTGLYVDAVSYFRGPEAGLRRFVGTFLVGSVAVATAVWLKDSSLITEPIDRIADYLPDRSIFGGDDSTTFRLEGTFDDNGHENLDWKTEYGQPAPNE